MTQHSALWSEEYSEIIVKIEPISPPLPPIKANIIDILKRLPLPAAQSPKYQDDGNSKAVELLRNSLNESVNPCDDFYEFTCGKWLANNPVPAGGYENTQLSQLSNSTKHQIYDLFVDPEASSSNAINRAKSMFGACIKYDRKKPSALMERINELGGWPILLGSQWDPGCFNLSHVLAKIKRSLGSCFFFMGSCNIFMGPKVEQNQHNASQQTIYFYQTHLGMVIGEHFRDETKLEQYSRRLMRMVKVLVADADIDLCEEKIRHEVDKILDFEKELANITKRYRGFGELKPSFKSRRFSNLVKILPELNLTEYFKILLPIQEFHEYFASDPEVFYDDIFFEKLSTLLSMSNKTTVANYVMLRYVMEWSNKHLDDRLEPEKAMTNDQLGMDCVVRVVDELRHAAGAMYVRKFFGNDSKNAALEMVENIRNTFRTMLAENTWMDPVTKKRALAKLNKVIPQIGYPDFYLHDSSSLDAYYNELAFNNNHSYSSMLEITSNFNTAKEFQKILAPTDRNEFDLAVYVVNAFFAKTKNTIHFPAAILQAPFFDQSFPKAMNYGGIGMLMGHEFTHGFDDEVGSKNDEIGNERCWWEPETKANFEKQKQCLINEYSTYRVPELNMTVNGTLTETENIADNGGIKEAFMAYKTYLNKLGHEEEHLPGFEKFTNEQLFFINFGIAWCGQNSVQMQKHLLKTDNHSPNRYRVNGPLPNLPEFAAAFNCPKGSPMNPEKKCRVW